MVTSTPSPTLKALTSEQVEAFRHRGYLAPLPLFTQDEAAALRADYPRLKALLLPELQISRINWWHKRNRTLYNLCMHPRVLDHVEDLLGPSFFLWGSQFFSKEPHDAAHVPWHQDAKYWPLAPQHSVTVFIAWSDCSPDNGCMRVVPGTHRTDDLLEHGMLTDPNALLPRIVQDSRVDYDTAVDLVLEPGWISLHHDGIVHGSGPNTSDRPRIAWTCRFSAAEVKCDLSVWPTFQAFPARGDGPFNHNPIGVPPTTEGAPTGMMQ